MSEYGHQCTGAESSFAFRILEAPCAEMLLEFMSGAKTLLQMQRAPGIETFPNICMPEAPGAEELQNLQRPRCQQLMHSSNPKAGGARS